MFTKISHLQALVNKTDFWSRRPVCFTFVVNHHCPIYEFWWGRYACVSSIRKQSGFIHGRLVCETSNSFLMKWPTFCQYWNRSFSQSNEPRHEKICLCHMRTTTHPRSLISAFAVQSLDSIIPKLAKSKISRLLPVCVAEQVGLRLYTGAKTSEDRLLHDVDQIRSVSIDTLLNSALHCSLSGTWLKHYIALLNLNIHTSYFSHVWIIRTNSSHTVKDSHELVTNFEHMCNTCVAYVPYRFYR